MPLFMDIKLSRYRISVGVRLNGTEPGNDRSRPYRDSSGSHSKVADAPRRLNQPYNRRIFGGILCTIGLQNSPLITCRHLIEFRPPNLDFILPLGHWGEPPPGRDADPHNVPYAEWLFWVFKDWFYVTRPERKPRICKRYPSP